MDKQLHSGKISNMRQTRNQPSLEKINQKLAKELRKLRSRAQQEWELKNFKENDAEKITELIYKIQKQATAKIQNLEMKVNAARQQTSFKSVTNVATQTIDKIKLSQFWSQWLDTQMVPESLISNWLQQAVRTIRRCLNQNDQL